MVANNNNNFRLIRKVRLKCEDNIKIDLVGVECDGGGRIQLDHDRV
jgi:hypothetical protein